MRKGRYHSLLLLLVAFVSAETAVASSGSGDIKVGYIFTDEEENLAVNQETYNVYEGFGLSLEDFQYRTNSGVQFRADMNNITLNNRQLFFETARPGLFRLSVRNNQYRRVYSFDGTDFTRRRATSINGSVMPTKNFRLFGGYNLTDKHGETRNMLEPTADSLSFATDYRHKSYNAGGQAFCPYGNLRMEYRRFDYTDELDDANNREASSFDISGFSRVPNHDWITLSSGYYYRQDKMDATTVELVTNQGWGATKITFLKNHTFDYRLLFARTRHEANRVETDNVINTFTITRTWPRLAGVRIGYENRIADDLVDRTVANGFYLNGWYKCKRGLRFKGRIAFRDKEVETGSTLVGDESYLRHLFWVTYDHARWGDITVRWDGRIRKLDDINSRIDYNTLSAALNFSDSRYGRATVSFSYYLGQYENRSDDVTFEFSDHAIIGAVYPVEWRGIGLSAGGTYLRSRRDQDIEKFSLRFGAGYTHSKDYRLEVIYNVYNFDDYLLSRQYYTANIVEVNLIKSLSF